MPQNQTRHESIFCTLLCLIVGWGSNCILWPPNYQHFRKYPPPILLLSPKSKIAIAFLKGDTAVEKWIFSKISFLRFSFNLIENISRENTRESAQSLKLELSIKLDQWESLSVWQVTPTRYSWLRWEERTVRVDWEVWLTICQCDRPHPPDFPVRVDWEVSEKIVTTHFSQESLRGCVLSMWHI